MTPSSSRYHKERPMHRLCTGRLERRQNTASRHLRAFLATARIPIVSETYLKSLRYLSSALNISSTILRVSSMLSKALVKGSSKIAW